MARRHSIETNASCSTLTFPNITYTIAGATSLHRSKLVDFSYRQLNFGTFIYSFRRNHIHGSTFTGVFDTCSFGVLTLCPLSLCPPVTLSPVTLSPVTMSPGHFVPRSLCPRSLCPRFTLSPGHFVSGHFVPGHFVPGPFVPRSVCPLVTLSLVTCPIYDFWSILENLDFKIGMRPNWNLFFLCYFQ
jgi:hypothetical protein